MRVCQGLISEGLSPLRPEEAEWLLSRAKRDLAKIKVLSCVSLVASFGMMFFGTPGLATGIVAVLILTPLMVWDYVRVRRRIQSVATGSVEVFRTPLPQIARDVRFRKVERKGWSDNHYGIPLRRTIPSGEGFFWGGGPPEKPAHSEVRIPPDYAVPEPYDGRPLTKDERRELWGKLCESILYGGSQGFAGIVLLVIPTRSASIGADMFWFYVVVGLFNLFAGVFRAFDRKSIWALRDGHAYLDGLEETLAGGRIWRYDGLPAIDRWRTTKKEACEFAKD